MGVGACRGRAGEKGRRTEGGGDGEPSTGMRAMRGAMEKGGDRSRAKDVAESGFKSV